MEGFLLLMIFSIFFFFERRDHEKGWGTNGIYEDTDGFEGI